MARNYAALPHEYLEEMQALSDEEFGRLVRGLLRYSMTGEPVQPAGNERFYAHRVMMQEDRFQASYNDLTARRSEAGRKAAQARWSREPDAAACERMPGNAKPGNTKTETETKTKQNNTTVPRSAERRNRAAPAAQTERMKQDMAEMAKWTEGDGKERADDIRPYDPAPTPQKRM
ncbi:MAG: DUF6291 domain-containing protein [Oscillospiraceae bacterium]